MSADRPALAVTIVTYNSAAHIADTLRALTPQLADGDELVIVDNRSSDETVETVQTCAPQATVLRQAGNLGFAAGCNAGAAASTAPLLLFLNPDATVEPDCLDGLRAAAETQPSWGAWQALVTLPDGGGINTSGGVVHFLGIGWAGACGEPLESAPSGPAEVGFASGAALVVRREVWDRVGGFDERYFMYCEDLDLSLRLWLTGVGVGVVPAARVEHDYEFTKGQRKWFLLERNRWWTLLSVYPTRLLLLLAPALLLTELALLAVAARGGWLRMKLRAQAAVLRELGPIRARRRQVQRLRRVEPAAFARRLSADLDNPYLGPAARLPGVVRLQGVYWALVRRGLGR